MRERFRHLHTAASLGATSQESMPSPASMDAQLCPSPVLSAQSGQLPVPQNVAASTATPQKCTPSKALSEARQSTKSPQRVQLPQPASAAASRASILQEFAQHRKEQHSPESGKVSLVNGGDVADKGNASVANSASTPPEQRHIHVCSSRVCSLQVEISIPFCL